MKHITWNEQNREPGSLGEAYQRLTDLQNDIEIILAQLAQPPGKIHSRDRGPAHQDWRAKAQMALAYKRSYARLLENWIKAGENEMARAFKMLVSDFLQCKEEVYNGDTPKDVIERYVEKARQAGQEARFGPNAGAE